LDLGVDIELVSNFPVTDNYAGHSFYQDNFTPEEIAYCIQQPSPAESFAGLFCAKEAMVKADNRMKEFNFSQLTIKHSNEGKPLTDGFSLSISHAGGLAIAVAVRHGSADSKFTYGFWLCCVGIVLSLVAILLNLFCLY
jgi:phosphopantetheine--protein transferase-like protein